MKCENCEHTEEQHNGPAFHCTVDDCVCMGFGRKYADHTVSFDSPLIGRRFAVLDQGHVMLDDVMGSDEAILKYARISYGKGTKSVSSDRNLIRYMMRHRHSTPFEKPVLILHVRCPMDCWRQWVRHRTASISEYSTRYSEAVDAVQRTAAHEWRLQSSVNKQGSGDFLPADIGLELSEDEASFQDHARDIYLARLSAGVSREQARKDLPLSTYTEAYWKIDLHNLLHFLGLRMDGHAQKEIRDYATVIGEQIVKPLFPNTWEAFEDYRLNAYTLSRMEIKLIQVFMTEGRDAAHALGEWCQMSQREKDEFKTRFPSW